MVDNINEQGFVKHYLKKYFVAPKFKKTKDEIEKMK